MGPCKRGKRAQEEGMRRQEGEARKRGADKILKWELEGVGHRNGWLTLPSPQSDLSFLSPAIVSFLSAPGSQHRVDPLEKCLLNE